MKSFWAVSIFTVWGVVITPNAFALPPNQSDNTGTNIWNNTAPIFPGGAKLSPEIISAARRLSKDLDDTNAACANSRAAVANIPQDAANPQPTGISTECQRLNSLVEETRNFLNNLNSSQAEQLRRSQVFRIW